jgi:hypothetical protein
MLKLTAAAEEPGPRVRQTALLRASVPAAMICFAVLAVGIATLGATFNAHRRLMPTALLFVLFAAYLVFCAALFALVLRVQYSARLDAARNALQQSTLIAASSGRIIIESTGPDGASSHDLNGTIRGFRVGRCGDAYRLECLQVLLEDGTCIQLLSGRDEVELKWVARALRSVVSGGAQPAMT